MQDVQTVQRRIKELESSIEERKDILGKAEDSLRVKL